MRFLYFILLSCSVMHAQQETSKWYFGDKCALDFSAGVPVSLSNSAMNVGEGCASMADAGGNLLFYTNGLDVWNKNHQLMANGSGLASNLSTRQPAFIARKPGSSSLYYLFTLGTGALPNLVYSVIDMSLAAGLGSVTVKNYPLATGMAEYMHGAMHCNQQDVWVMAHKHTSNAFNAFLLSAAGVNTVPVVSFAGAVYNNYIGTLKISPSGRKIGVVSYSVELFDFDPSTGQVSNANLLLDTVTMYGCEFSPDGTKFYASQNAYAFLHQWDLCAGSSTAIAATHFTFNTQNTLVGQFQSASDGKVYAGTQFSVSVIHDPNLAGSACNLALKALSVGTGTPDGSLPNLMAFRQKAKFSSTVNCGSASFSYTPPVYCSLANDAISAVLWQFGDPGSGAANTSTVSTPVHAYAANGQYTVSLITYYPCFTDTIRQVVTVNALPTLTISGKTTVCKNEAAILSAGGAASYTWSTGQQTSTLAINTSTGSTYTVTGTHSNSCQGSKSVTVTVNPCLGLDETRQNAALTIYPNPGDGYYTIDTQLTSTLAVFNLMGELLMEVPVGGPSQKLDLSILPSGIYIVELGGNSTGRKILIRN